MQAGFILSVLLAVAVASGGTGGGTDGVPKHTGASGLVPNWKTVEGHFASTGLALAIPVVICLVFWLLDLVFKTLHFYIVGP